MSKAEDDSMEMSIIFLCLYLAMDPLAKFWLDEMALSARTGKSIQSQTECHKVSLLLVKPD